MRLQVLERLDVHGQAWSPHDRVQVPLPCSTRSIGDRTNVKATRRALRRAGGAFTLLHQHEFEALLPICPWAVTLFAVLLQFVDHKTGAGRVTYSALSECLAPSQPARGPRLYAPDPQAVKRIVLAIEATRILARDIGHSNGNTSLFFSVAPRHAQARPQRNSTPKLDPHQKLSTPATARPAARSSEKLDPQTRPPLQESISLHKESASYPHVDKSKADLKRVRDEIAARRGTPQKRPPHGG